MKVNTHLIILTVISAFGAVLLMVGVTLSYLDLERERESQKIAYETLNELENTKLDLSRLLTTGDLVFGVDSGVNTYLVQPMVVQIRQLERRVQKQAKQQRISRAEGLLMQARLVKLRELFTQLLTKPQEDGYSIYEEESNQLIVDFQTILTKVKRGSETNRLNAAHKRRDLSDTALQLSLLYAALMFILVIWGSRSISVPLSRLSLSARRSLEKNDPFEIDQAKGPKEVRSLADMIFRLINQLEGEVYKKTSDLEQENQVRRQAEGRLLALTAQQAPLVEAWNQMSEAVEILDPEGLLLFVNPAYQSLSEQSSTDQLLSKPSALIESEVLDEILSHARRGLSWTKEVEVKIKRQKRIHELHSSPVLQEGNELSQVIVIRRDITEERVAQASAAHNDRLAAIGTLAAGMAHEINNPLMYIKMSLDLIMEEFEERKDDDGALKFDPEMVSEMTEALSDASDGVDRVTYIVQSLLNVARSGRVRGSSEQISSMQLLELFKTCAHLIKSDISTGVEVNLNIREDLIVWGRRSELIQVFLNFLMNAVQAMPAEQAHKWINVTALHKGQSTEVVIQDNGVGINPDDLHHIFDPFYSSKPVGEGTGLGLPVSKGIIEAHQGSVEVSSQLGEGTTFVIRLPLIEAALPKMITSDLKQAQERASGDERHESGELKLGEQPLRLDLDLERDASSHHKILIVDDDVLVSKSLRKMLSHYELTVVNSAISALDCIGAERFDLILSDVVMPELNGIDFYWRVVKDHDIYRDRFVFLTGAAKGLSLNQKLLDTGRPVLRKPISKQALLSSVKQLLVGDEGSRD